MIVETGVIVFLSLIVMVWRLPKRMVLWLFGHPMWLEIPFGFLAYALHYGTFSGMMAAAVAAVLCFGFVQLGKIAIGYIDKTGYHPGFIQLNLSKE